MKRCTCCGIEKPFSEFHKHKNEKDGYQYQCKKCKQENYNKNKIRYLQQAKKYYNDPIVKEHRKKYKKNWKKINIEHVKQIDREYFLKNKDKIKNYHREWQRNYRKTEKNKDYRKEYYIKNKIHRKEWIKKNRQKISKQQKDYNNSLVGKISSAKRWAKRKNMGFVEMLQNPFPKEIQIDYHHINNMIVIPLPRITHRFMGGRPLENHLKHNENMIKKIYCLNFEKLFFK